MKQILIVTILSLFIATLGCETDDTKVSPITSPSIGEISFSWLGDYTSHPSVCDETAEYDAYYNTTEGKSYFCDGIDWRMLAQDGTNGTDGTDGTDGVDGTDGTDGVDGIDGKTIQVSDINNNLLGYSIDFNLLFSPNGYLFYVYTSTGTLNFGSHPVLFLTTDCTGDGLVRTDTDIATRGILVYDTVNDTFRTRRNVTVHTTTIYSMAADGVCYTTTLSTTFYKYDTITRADAGIPETITLPLVYEFKP